MKSPSLLYPLLILVASCHPTSGSQTSADNRAQCQAAASDPNNAEGGCGMPQTMSDDEVLDQELRVLTQETPKNIKLESLYADFGYTSFPNLIFARKGAPNAMERSAENIPKGSNDSAAHSFLMRLGQQIYQQALLADKSKDMVYADNALMLIKMVSESKLSFINNPLQPNETNDNRYLEIGWFLSLVSRGARILDLQMQTDWKTKNSWDQNKKALNDWIGNSIDQNWGMADALNQSPLNLAAHAGSMNWVGSVDTLYGSTNRTFAMLEAQFRVAELRGGAIGPMNMVLNAWQKPRGMAAQHDGSVDQLFQHFRGYLQYYFNKPISKDPLEYKLNYSPDRNMVNSDPNALNEEPCLDPSNFGYKASCLINKDAYRNDTYHAQMGFAAVLNIIEIGERWNLKLTAEEKEKVIKGLRWTCMNNTPGVTASQGAHGIAVWEVAFRLFPAAELGPYCQRDLAIDRSNDYNKRSGLAWGYSRLALGF